MPRRKQNPSRSPEERFGETMRHLRKLAGKTQDDLAAESGYHRNYIGELERGLKSPSLRAIFALAKCLGVSPATMVKRAEDRE
jgi:transcriptional regulator with XRE-family HTH domain